MHIRAESQCIRQKKAEDVCRRVYEETLRYYDEVAPELGKAALGFRILYGPPVINAPFLFLGYQPGGRKIEYLEHHVTWPNICDYITRDWPLAKRVRSIWEPSIVARSTGLNAVFFRARSVRLWNKIEKSLRKNLENFSRQRAEQIVRALQPEYVIVIGLGTFYWLTEGEPALFGERGRVLARKGELWGCRAIGTVHLTGSRISRGDRERLRIYFETIQSVERE